jgi:hypothetical protein
MSKGIEQQTNLLEELAKILGLEIEDRVPFGRCLRKAEWKIWQLTTEKADGSGNLLNRLHAMTGLRDFDDSFESSSPARVAEVLFGIKPEEEGEGIITVSREAFREVAHRIADPNMTEEERVSVMTRLFDQAGKDQAEK